MRRLLFWIFLLLVTVLVLPAAAETHVLDDLLASVEIPEGYITITEENLSTYAAWLESRGSSVEETAADFQARGVLMQCWTEAYDACMELTAVQNSETLNIFDVNEQDSSMRGTYRLAHYPQNLYLGEGYDFSTSNWKNTPSGRFLILRYIKRDGGEIDHRGYMRRTIRNGYEITFDMQVFGRNLTNKDNSALNKIWDTFQFVEVLPMPPAAAAKIFITEAPPQETNSDSFTIEGTASQGVKLLAVVMGLNYPDPIRTEVVVGGSGKFKLPITLPREGVFMITVEGEYEGETVVELAFPFITYQHTLLAVNLTTPYQPDAVNEVTTDEITLAGTGEPGATIQIFVNGEALPSKRVTTAGRFSIDIETPTEGPYEVVLAFSKKDLSDRRFSFPFVRKWSEQDMIRDLDRQAISPGYSTLVDNIDGYDGRIMGYECYMVNVTQSGGEWIAQMALSRRGGEYRSMILVTCGEEPKVPVDGQIMMYGTCAGMSLPSEEDENQASYPCFELLLFVSLE